MGCTSISRQPSAASSVGGAKSGRTAPVPTTSSWMPAVTPSGRTRLKMILGSSGSTTRVPLLNSTDPVIVASGAGGPPDASAPCHVVVVAPSTSRLRTKATVSSSIQTGKVSSPASPEMFVVAPATGSNTQMSDSEPMLTPMSAARAPSGDHREKNAPGWKSTQSSTGSATGSASIGAALIPAGTPVTTRPVHNSPGRATNSGSPSGDALSASPSTTNLTAPESSRSVTEGTAAAHAVATTARAPSQPASDLVTR